METISHGPAETKKMAENLVSFLENMPTQSGATVVCLSGDLGSGKTTFTQFFGQLLGIQETIASPTFVIQKIYKIGMSDTAHVFTTKIAEKFSHLIHIDAYRIDSETEMETLGWKDIVADPQNLILVEWPERITGILPADHIKISFEHKGASENGENTESGEHENWRKIKISTVGGKNLEI